MENVLINKKKDLYFNEMKSNELYKYSFQTYFFIWLPFVFIYVYCIF